MTRRPKTTKAWIKQIQEKLRERQGTRHLDFQEITKRTGVSARNLRYVLDHQLLGENVFTSDDKPHTSYGVVRQFSVCSSFMLSLAGVMLEAGLRSGLVRDAIKGLFDWASSGIDSGYGPSLPSFLVFIWSAGLVVEVGDGANIRVQVDAHRLAGSRLPCPKPTGWQAIDNGSPVAGGYVPLVLLRLDLGEIRGRLD